MVSTKLAEAILSAICGRERAGEMVGDLLEQHASMFVFWREVMAILGAFTWRWIAGFGVAALSMMLILTQYAGHAIATSDHRIAAMPGRGWVLAGLCAWSVMALNLVRFGWADRVSGVSFGAAVLLLGIACTSEPHRALYGGVGVIAFVAVCLPWKSLRAGLLCLIVSATAFAAMFGGLIVADSWSTDSPKRMAFQFVGIWIISLLLEGWSLSRMRGAFLTQRA